MFTDRQFEIIVSYLAFLDVCGGGGGCGVDGGSITVDVLCSLRR